ncbi:uncharacterized protein C8Q71DRAFT_259353 [Rhodofomes roseus]|uniref:Uncharacterized protein n=1 Tax=Rhodofomes roseus TaxID=34475 RepID=A0ABQ8K646_9APHY|nr:uncharacterized protein C8Q71DRAFT_259353 [Rhodofomes roseus]KAH9832570.1 hypothetical protein C8Q71DRAFT_259353 [Rhodofomes roseus]
MPPPVYKLMTVNTVPERAKRIIGRIVEDVKDRWTIQYVVNAERIEEVLPTLERERPDIMFVASMWTPEEQQELVLIAEQTIPGIKTFKIPSGLQVEKGPDAIVDFIKENLPSILDSPAPKESL